jgi:hypothetical protein
MFFKNHEQFIAEGDATQLICEFYSQKPPPGLHARVKRTDLLFVERTGESEKEVHIHFLVTKAIRHRPQTWYSHGAKLFPTVPFR